MGTEEKIIDVLKQNMQRNIDSNNNGIYTGEEIMKWLELHKNLTEETLEDIIEDIGKRMCHFGGIYPNGGYWNIKDIWDWTYKGETLIEVFKAFRDELKKNGHYN